MQQATKQAKQYPKRLFLVKDGRALIFPDVPPDVSNAHLWARSGEVVDASHPVLLAIAEQFPHKVKEITEADLRKMESQAAAAKPPRQSPVSARLHPSIKARIRDYDAGNTSKAKKLSTAAAEKAKSAGVDPAKLPSLVPEK